VKPISLKQAATDRRLFGTVHPLHGPQLRLLELMGGDAMLAVIAVGRQSGKSTAACLTALWNATCRPDLDAVLPPSDERFVLVLATDQEQARLTIRRCAGMLERSPLRALIADVTADQIVLKIRREDEIRRVVIRAMPTRSAGLRGPSASLIVWDEAAHAQRDTGGPADERQLEAAMAGCLMAFGTAAKQVWISTPNGESGRFFEMFRAAEAGVLDSAVCLTAPTWEMRPDLPQSYFDAQRAQLGEDGFSQEYGAQFVSSGGAFFDLREVVMEPGPCPPGDGHSWILGLDPAFSSDSFGVALVGVSRHERGVLVLGEVAGIQPKGRLLSLERRRAREDRVLEEVMGVAWAYQPTRVVSDQHMADAIRSRFGREGWSVTIKNLSGPSQSQAFTSTRARLLDGSLRIWSHELLLEELRRVRAHDSERVVLPRRGSSHCDIASALCLATFEHRTVSDAPPVEYRPLREGEYVPPFTHGLLTEQF